MVPDIYEMTLSAEVVVLSGCQTALGRQVRGEGPIGMARALMYAGVPRVVASLWPLDDLATSELMKRFYRAMLVTRLTPAAALRAAQRELAATDRWRSPITGRRSCCRGTGSDGGACGIISTPWTSSSPSWWLSPSW